MRQRSIVPALCILFLAAGPAAPADTAARPPALPEHVLYGQMFRHVVELEKQADAVEKRGEDGAKYRLRYQQSAALSDRQDTQLKTIAQECMERVAEQDLRARDVIRAARAQAGGRELAPGQTPPRPPAELAELQEERNALILEARDRLHGAFGQEEFKRFDTFLREKLGPRIRQATPGIPNREGQRPSRPEPERQ